MKKNSVNILIDANNFWQRTLFSSNFANKKTKLFNDEDHGIYIRKLATDFTAFIRRFKGNYSSIIVCVDSKSWRKTEPDLVDVGYKAGRVRKKEINWKAYNAINERFIEILLSIGVNVVKVDNTEADDLIRGYVEYYKEIGENTVVWSADNDLTQLIYFNENSFNIQYYQPPMQKNSIMGTKEFFSWLNGNDSLESSHSPEDILFNLAEMTKDSFNITLSSIITRHGLLSKVIDTDEVVFKKIVGGDKSDGIAQIKAGIGKKTLENVWSEHYKSGFSVDQSLTEIYQMGIIDRFQKIGKLKTDDDVVSATKQLKLNVKLIILDKRTAPEHINIAIDESISNEEFTRVDTLKIENMKTLLDGTEFFDSKQVNAIVPKSMDPFANITEAADKKTKQLF